MRRRRILFAAFLPLVLSSTSNAEPAPADAFQHAPKRQTGPVSLQLDDAELGDLVKVISDITGKRFVLGTPKLSKLKATLVAPEKVSVDVAYQAFLSVLAHNGLTVLPRAGYYDIVESQEIARQLTPFERGELTADERYVTRVHRLKHLPAEEVASTLLSKLQTKDASIIPYGNVLIVTETAANLRRMLEIVDVIDEAREEDKLWVRPVRYLAATQIEKQLSEVLGLRGGKDAAAEAAGASGALHVSRIVAIERPNALAIVATKASFDRIASLLDTMDVAPDSEVSLHVVMLQHADAKKIVGPLNEAIGSAASPAAPSAGKIASAAAPVLESSVKIAADETTNALLVTATPRDFARIRDVIRALDQAKRQVFIEAAILDISADSGLDLGVAWHGGLMSDSMLGPKGSEQSTVGGWRAGSSAMPPSATDLQSFALGVRGPEIPFATGIPGISRIPSFGALLTAVATSKGADILSMPTILASDNTQAEIKVQLQTSLQPNAPSISSLSSLIPGAASIPGLTSMPAAGGVTANYRGIGPHVKVTPHLNDSDEVRLDITEIISDVQNVPGPQDTFGTISYLERTASTTLTVKDGRTVVIGGLTRNRVSRTESKVPVLGDIPVLGALFRTRSDRTEKSNLVLVLTPYIIRDEADMRRIYERKQQERQELIDREAIFKTASFAATADWKRTLGLVARIRSSHLDVARERKAAEASIPKLEGEREIAPFELPVAPSAAGGSIPKSASSSPGSSVPARPNVIER